MVGAHFVFAGLQRGWRHGAERQRVNVVPRCGCRLRQLPQRPVCQQGAQRGVAARGGGHGAYHRQAQFLGQCLHIDLDAALFCQIDHVERHDAGQV